MKKNSEEQSNDLWEHIECDNSLVENALSLAKRDIRTATDVFSTGDFDWSLAISYNAMLQAGRALMFFQGVRPKGAHKHLSVLHFLETQSFLSKDLLYLFNKSRKKRHKAVYEQMQIVSRTEAQTMLSGAKEFVERIGRVLGC